MQLIDLGYKFETSDVLLRGEHRFRHGELVHLTGKNGSGKTTILEILAGLLDDHTGTCEFPSNWSARYVPTNITSSLFLPWYTVRRNIDFLVKETPARSKAHELGQRFLNSTFDRLLDQPAYTPSAGESAAIAIACAMATDPYAILLDETLSYTAPALAQKVAQVLEAFVARGHLLFVVGHRELPFAGTVRTVRMVEFDDEAT